MALGLFSHECFCFPKCQNLQYYVCVRYLRTVFWWVCIWDRTSHSVY